MLATEVLKLLQPFIVKNLILPRTLTTIGDNINDFVIIKKNKQPIACAGLKPYSCGLGEIYAIAVADEYQKQGYSTQLLTNIKNCAQQQNIRQLFAISKYQKGWFIRHGFTIATLTDIPLKRQQQFDHQRKSNIFIKNVD